MNSRQEVLPQVENPDLMAEAQRIWREFNWNLTEEFSNKETIHYCLYEIAKEFPDFFEGSHPEILMAEIGEKKSELLKVYRKIFPKNKQHEPFYHNISEDEDWNDHVGYVMASSARLFLGLLKMQKMLVSSSENGYVEMKAVFAKKFGDVWLNKIFTLSDLRKSLSMALVHELGEWWSRGIWSEVLELQRQEIEEWRRGEREVEAVHKIKELVVDFRRKNILGYYRRVHKIKKLVDEVKKIVQEYGIKIELYLENPTEFSVYLIGGSGRDADFLPVKPIKTNGTKIRVLNAIFKGADFSQLFARDYLKNHNQQVWGSLALFVEMLEFRPNGLVLPDWKKIEDASLTDDFFNDFFSTNFDEAMVWLFLISGEMLDFSKLRAIQSQATIIVDKRYDGGNSNIRSLLIMSEVFSTVFSQQQSLQSE